MRVVFLCHEIWGESWWWRLYGERRIRFQSSRKLCVEETCRQEWYDGDKGVSIGAIGLSSAVRLWRPAQSSLSLCALRCFLCSRVKLIISVHRLQLSWPHCYVLSSFSLSLKAEAGQEVQNCGNNELAAHGHAICRQGEHIYQSSWLWLAHHGLQGPTLHTLCVSLDHKTMRPHQTIGLCVDETSSYRNRGKA